MEGSEKIGDSEGMVVSGVLEGVREGRAVEETGE